MNFEKIPSDLSTMLRIRQREMEHRVTADPDDMEAKKQLSIAKRARSKAEDGTTGSCDDCGLGIEMECMILKPWSLLCYKCEKVKHAI